MKDDIFVRSWLAGVACALALVMGAATAHAAQLGVVDFANGSTHPTKIPASLVAQTQAAAKGRGRVILLRGGASPVGSRSYNFVLSGERVAAIRDRLVAAGIPRKKIASQYVGIVNRGSAAADREVIVDATTRAALGMAVPASAGERAALNRLEAQVKGLEAAAHKALPRTKRVKANHTYTGRVWYATRNMADNITQTVQGFGTIPTFTYSFGDNYQSTAYGFDLRERRPADFSFWTPYQIPLQFALAGMSQTWQVSNPSDSYRDVVGTQFIHGSVQSPWNVFGVTVTPGVKIGWLGEESLSGSGGNTGCYYSASGGYCYGNTSPVATTAVGGSSVTVTPSLSIGGQGWQIGYSQSPWGGQGYYAPRVLMATAHGRGVSLSLGEAFPDCPMCSSNGAAIQNGQIVKLAVHGGGWGGSLIYVAGEQFTAGGVVMPALLMQSLAPFNPAHPWNSYNPGLTISLEKRLARGLYVAAAYNYQSETGASAGGTPGLISGQTTAVTKTTELSIRGRF